MRWYRFGTDFFVCDCEKRKMYWMYIQFFGKKQAGKDVPKMCRRINQRFLYIRKHGKRSAQKAGMQGVADPLHKNLNFSPFPGGEGGRGDGAMRFTICTE